MIPPDHVTALAPRAELERVLAEALAPDAARPVAIAMCDVVGLKEVNERDGFRAGDTVLATAAAAARQAAGDAAIVARLGGDEMVAVFTGPGAPAAADRTARDLAAATAPRLRAAAAIAERNDTPGTIIDRLYAALRAS
ncbi:MAG: diguanylate cyclase domain-containing protein [Pirellulales bacterium]